MSKELSLSLVILIFSQIDNKSNYNTEMCEMNTYQHRGGDVNRHVCLQVS